MLDLKEFNVTILPLIQMFISCIGLLSILLLWHQLRATHKWNKIKTNFTFVTTEENKAETDLYMNAKELGIDLKLRKKPLTIKEVNLIIAHDDTFHAMMAYLMHVENKCTAINNGIVDKKIAYAAFAPQIRDAYIVYKPYLKKIQSIYNDKQVYCEFESYAEEIIKLKQQS